MTGKEAWSIVAPIIAAHSVVHDGLGLVDEAYVVVFTALKDYDEKREKEEG